MPSHNKGDVHWGLPWRHRGLYKPPSPPFLPSKSTSSIHIQQPYLIIQIDHTLQRGRLCLLLESSCPERRNKDISRGLSRLKSWDCCFINEIRYWFVFDTIFHGSFALGIIWYQDFIILIAVRFIFQDVFFIEVLAYLFVLPSYMVSAFRKFGGWLCIITKENNIHLMTGWSHHVVDRQTSSSEHMWQQRNNTRSDETSGCPTKNALLSPMFFFSHISNLSSGRITHSHLLEPTKHSHHPHSWFSPPFLESSLNPIPWSIKDLYISQHGLNGNLIKVSFSCFPFVPFQLIEAPLLLDRWEMHTLLEVLPSDQGKTTDHYAAPRSVKDQQRAF